MKKLLLFLLMPIHLFAQFTDGFDDLELGANPAWLGDTARFIVSNDALLRLYASDADTSMLYTANQMLDNAEWNFWVKLAFAPSNNNLLRVYLVSDSQNFKGPLNGYYLRFGETGADDSIDLYRQDGDDHTLIIDGINAHCGGSVNTIGIRVLRDDSGNWQLFSDILGGTDYSLEGTALDITHTVSSWFGLFCKYTSSNAQKFYFDNFYVGDIIVDTIAPSITQLNISLPLGLVLQISEPLDSATAVQFFNYHVSNGVGAPNQISYLPGLTNLNLQFAQDFQPDLEYELSINNLQDVNGNTIADTTILFSWHQVAVNDVVINEIMADPNPQVGLPEEEYLEIFNNSDYALSLQGWTFKVGSTEKPFPDYLLPAKQYLILCSTTTIDEFQVLGEALGISGFQSLTNAGNTIELIDSLGTIINTVSYTDDWYKDADKEDGGWSLERIDPNNNCSAGDNWAASLHNAGGTPGTENSVFGTYIDDIAPQLLHYNFINATELRLTFSEAVLLPAYIDTLFEFNSAISISNVLAEANFISLYLAEALSQGSHMILQVNGLADVCENYLFESYELSYYTAQQYDVLINELMADPTPSVSLPELEYIEIINRAAFNINLENWKVQLNETERICKQVLLAPGAYLVLCPEDGCSQFGSFINCMDILGASDLANDGKTIALMDPDRHVISAVSYTSDWYQDNYKADGGWSLERIDVNNICGEETNWIASESEMGGTPGSSNSVAAANPDNEAPFATRAIWIDDFSAGVFFSESLDTTLLKLSDFTLNESIEPVEMLFDAPMFQSVQLIFTEELNAQIIHNLQVKNLTDCCGNLNPNEELVRFGKPEEIEANDLVINEVLFNPIGNGADFVELYNRSEKVIDLNGLKIANWDEDYDTFGSIKEIRTSAYQIFPEEYLVLTSDPNQVLNNYYESDANAFLFPDCTLPTLSNENGRVIILDKSLQTIDDFSYSEVMHFKLLTSFDGVSLERLNHDWPANESGNWHSAAERVGFATPGLRNSQFTETKTSVTTLTVSPELFSPDNDGFEDVLLLAYKFESPGYIGTITIFDSNGRTIRKLINEELLAVEGTLVWDGINDAGTKARIGIYIIFFEYFNPQGETGKIKETCVLAGRLD